MEEMASYSPVFVLLSVWTCICGVSGLLEFSQRPQCNQTVTSLQELQEAALDDDHSTRSTDFVLCVDLRSHSAPQNVSYVKTSIDYATVIISGNNSVVKCETSRSDLPLSDYTRFPLIFSNSSLVVVEGVRFEGCMRPIQFKWVNRVELISSSFR